MSKKDQMRMLRAKSKASENLMDREAVKLVEKVRLKQIENETKSAGALLDTRHLFKLEKVQARNAGSKAAREKAQAAQQAAAAQRVDSRRGGRGQEELNQAGEAAIQHMISKGMEIANTSNYENEELMWSTKSNDPNYTRKRRFDNPELHAFKNNLDVDQKKMYVDP